MKFGRLALMLVSGLVAVGCKTAVIDGTGGAASTSVATSTTTAKSSTATGVAAECATLPCFDDDMVDGNDCLSCSQTTGECKLEAETCGTNPECGAFVDCFTACPVDDPMTPADEELACLCTDDGTGKCKSPSEPGTCVGDHPDGVNDYVSLVTCVLGDGGENPGACGAVCEQ